MIEYSVNDIQITPLEILPVPSGDVMRAMKFSDKNFKNFGEAYFSKINSNAIKAWKMHRKMTLNLVVPIGNVKFVFFDQYSQYREVSIGSANYSRVTVPPGIWFGFMSLGEELGLILNIADMIHDPLEVSKKSRDEIHYDWLR